MTVERPTWAEIDLGSVEIARAAIDAGADGLASMRNPRHGDILEDPDVAL